MKFETGCRARGGKDTTLYLLLRNSRPQPQRGGGREPEKEGETADRVQAGDRRKKGASRY